MPRKKRTIQDALGRNMPLVRRGFGTLRQLPSGNWQASYIGPDEQRHKAPRTFLTRDAGEAWLAQQRTEIANGQWQAREADQQFGDYAQTWLATHRRKDGTELAAKTKDNYRRWLNQLEELNDLNLGEITPSRLRNIHANQAQERGATTAGRQMGVVQRVLNTAVQDGLIAKNPVPTELTSTATGITHRPPTDEEIAILLDHLEPRLRLAAQIAAFAGLRIGEWRALRRRDLTKSDGYWIINIARQAVLVDGQWLSSTPKSEAGTRKVALPLWLNDDVELHLAGLPTDPDSLLFPASGSGEFIDSEWRNAWDAARTAAGIKDQVRGHDLRAYYATTLANSGASAPLLQTALGHATIAMSMKYVKRAQAANTQLPNLIPQPGKIDGQ